MDNARKVFLRFALSKEPKVVEQGLSKLEGLLKSIGKVQDGEFKHFHQYSEVIDAYRDVLFFLDHSGGDAEKLKRETPVLQAMSKNPFQPDAVVGEFGENAFTQAVAEVKTLAQAYDKVKPPPEEPHPLPTVKPTHHKPERFDQRRR